MYSWAALKVVGLVVATTLLTETLLYLFQYRTPAFQRVKSSIERQSKKLEELAQKEGRKDKDKDKAARKKERLESSMRRDMMAALGPMRLQITLLTAALMFGSFRLTNKWFAGAPVARLPFEPFELVRKVSHRGLQGSDSRDCALAFIYMLCQMSLRAIISKALGWGPTRAMNAMNAYKPPADPKAA